MATQRLNQVILFGAAGWLIIAALLLLQFWPTVPRTFAGWVLFIAIGPPLYGLMEVFGGWLFSERHGKLLSHVPFSLLRMLVALLVTLAIVGGFWWVLSYLAPR